MLQVTAAGSSSLWSVWSWVTELLVCGLVPLIILLLNVLVIAETRRLLEQQKQMTYSVRLVSTKSSTQAALAAGPQGDAAEVGRQVWTFKIQRTAFPLFHTQYV